MTNRYKVVLVSGLIISAIIIYMLFLKGDSNELKQALDANSTSTEVTLTSTTITNKVIPTNTDSIRDRAWDVLERYLGYAKSHDLAGITSLSYQLSDSCKKINDSQAMKDDCNSRMDSAYKLGYLIKKNSLVYVWNDNKQIILSSGWTETDQGAGLYSMTRSIVFFVIDNQNNIKLLSFKLNDGVTISNTDKEPGKPDQTLDATGIKNKLTELTEDKDQDGISDYVETCSDPSIIGCIKTDPTKRDTDGNGFWDGIQALFYK